MKALIVFLTVVSLSLSLANDVKAHGDHGPTMKKVSATEVQQRSLAIIDRLIAKNKIPPSWKRSKFLSADVIRFGKKQEWLAAIENKAITDPKKQKLYIFLKLNGDYVAANFTGK